MSVVQWLEFPKHPPAWFLHQIICFSLSNHTRLYKLFQVFQINHVYPRFFQTFFRQEKEKWSSEAVWDMLLGVRSSSGLFRISSQVQSFITRVKQIMDHCLFLRTPEALYGEEHVLGGMMMVRCLITEGIKAVQTVLCIGHAPSALAPSHAVIPFTHTSSFWKGFHAFWFSDILKSKQRVLDIPYTEAVRTDPCRRSVMNSLLNIIVKYL